MEHKRRCLFIKRNERTGVHFEERNGLHSILKPLQEINGPILGAFPDQNLSFLPRMIQILAQRK